MIKEIINSTGRDMSLNPSGDLVGKVMTIVTRAIGIQSSETIDQLFEDDDSRFQKWSIVSRLDDFEINIRGRILDERVSEVKKQLLRPIYSVEDLPHPTSITIITTTNDVIESVTLAIAVGKQALFDIIRVTDSGGVHESFREPQLVERVATKILKAL